MINVIKKVKFPLMLIMLAMISISTYSLRAETINAPGDKDKKVENNKNSLQARSYSGVFDLQQNSVSNLDFYTTNYGIFGFDIARGRGGGFWPRGSQNQYIFAGGFWFGARKYRARANDTVSYVTITYNPNSGDGWFVPGRINYGGPGSKEVPDEELVNKDEILKYRTYFSTDFNPGSGAPIDLDHQISWPIWDASVREEDTLKNRRYFGYYIPQVELRKTDNFKKGPAFISGEDIFSTYKDTDLNYYEGGVAARRERGYPLKLQVEQMIYSWGFGDYRDFIFIKYEISNYSTDTLWQCWLTPVMDVDIARALQSSFGAGNDRAKFYDCDTTLNLAVQWTNTDRGEFGHGFGYLGFSFLESPAIQKYYDTTIAEIKDPQGNVIRMDTTLTLRPYDPQRDTELPNFVRKDSSFYDVSSQLGLVTFRNWSIEFDPQEDEQRYQFISSKLRDGDTGPGDKRFMMATGEFNMRPGDTARVLVGIILANTAKGGEADGSCEDMAELERKTIFAQEVYDNNFRAPIPPDRANFTQVIPLNNGVTIVWDSTSEMSIDIDERGLDFMGYQIFRARRANLDGYSPNNEQGSNEYPLGRGPLGWKPIAAYSLRTPFIKTDIPAGKPGEGDKDVMPLIDDFEILGPYTDASGNVIDTMAVRIMRRGVGVTGFSNMNGGIASVDTSAFSAPWGHDWFRILKEDPSIEIENDGTITANYNGQRQSLIYSTSPSRRHYIFDSVFVGVAHLNKSLLKFNPLFYQRKILNRPQSYFRYLDSIYPDWVVGQRKRVYEASIGDSVWLRYTTDTVYLKNTVKRGEVDGNPQTFVEAWVPRPLNLQNDSLHVLEVRDSIIAYIQQSQVKIDYPDYETREHTRSKVIAPYMAWRTNNRTLTDIGDDNRDGWLNADPNPTITERLLNNIEYFYKIESFDEGDYTQPTEMKFNMASPGLPNFTTAIPTAAPVDKLPELEVIYVDSARIGGLSNFQFFAVDQDRVQQRFAGDTLELLMNPYWDQISLTLGGSTAGKLGLYRTLATIKSRMTGDTLYYGLLSYESQPCQVSFYNLFTENAASYVLSDTVIVDTIGGKDIDFGTARARGVVTRTGRFFSGDFSYPGYCYSQNWTQNAYGILGFSFNFTIQQYAGRLRPDTVEIAQGVTATVNVKPIPEVADRITSGNPNVVMVTQPVAFNYSTYSMIYGSFNNGPAIYEVEFLPGGTQEVDLSYKKAASQNKFVVPYLNLRVRNIAEYLRPVAGATDSVAVKYPLEITNMNIPPVSGIRKTKRFDGITDYTGLYPINLFPDPRNLTQLGMNTDEFIGKYNIYAYGYVAYDNVHSRVTTNRLSRTNQVARPITGLGSGADDATFTGLQGRYYMTGVSVDGKDTVDFVNVFNGGGLQFAFDFANKGLINVRESEGFVWDRIPDFNLYQAQDFKPGDKVYLKTYGGALGLPMPGAKVLAIVSNKSEGEGYLTDELMDGIQISPNPYYITHQAVKSPYDSKLFFSKLPPKATIEIYTVVGDLITTLNHDEYNNEGAADRHAVAIWDLLSKNRQRVQSQSLIAVITAPNGAKTIKNFSVVVGGFRLIEQ